MEEEENNKNDGIHDISEDENARIKVISELLQAQELSLSGKNM